MPRCRSSRSASSARSRPPALVAVAAHYAARLSLDVAGLIGAALAPTDPAVTFSVLGGKEVARPLGHDPRGRVGLQRPRRHRPDDRDGRARDAGRRLVLDVVERVRRRDGIGLAVGVAGALAARCRSSAACRFPSRRCIRCGDPRRAASSTAPPRSRTARASSPSSSPGILVGDVRVAAAGARSTASTRRSPTWRARRVRRARADGRSRAHRDEGLWWRRPRARRRSSRFVVRPLVGRPLLLPCGSTWGERCSSSGAGSRARCRSCSPSLAVVGGTDDATEIYGIVFVVVLFSVRRPGHARADRADAARRADGRARR